MATPMTRRIVPALLRSSTRSTRPTGLTSIRHSSSEPHWNKPSGWLFGEKPLAQGEKRKWESWETIWYFGFYGTSLAAVVAYLYKPQATIQDWAREEAMKRMTEKGELPDYERS